MWQLSALLMSWVSTQNLGSPFRSVWIKIENNPIYAILSKKLNHDQLRADNWNKTVAFSEYILLSKTKVSKFIGEPFIFQTKILCANYLSLWFLVSPRLDLGFVIILEKLIVTLGEINQKFLKIVKMYFIQNISIFTYLVTF